MWYSPRYYVPLRYILRYHPFTTGTRSYTYLQPEVGAEEHARVPHRAWMRMLGTRRLPDPT